MQQQALESTDDANVVSGVSKEAALESLQTANPGLAAESLSDNVDDNNSSKKRRRSTAKVINA